MAGYFKYYINVYDQYLTQLHGIGEFKTVKETKSAAVHHLEDSRLPYHEAVIHVMHYNARDYNDKNGPEIHLKWKK